MLNGVQIVGTVRETDVKTYPDGAVITHFKLDCPRATRVDTFTCRLFQRKGTAICNMALPREGEVVAIAGRLTTAGTDGRKVCIDVLDISRPERWRT